MAKHRSHSIAFKRQIAQEFISGETLHDLAKRHDPISIRFDGMPHDGLIPPQANDRCRVLRQMRLEFLPGDEHEDRREEFFGSAFGLIDSLIFAVTSVTGVTIHGIDSDLAGISQTPCSLISLAGQTGHAYPVGKTGEMRGPSYNPVDVTSATASGEQVASGGLDMKILQPWWWFFPALPLGWSLALCIGSFAAYVRDWTRDEMGHPASGMIWLLPIVFLSRVETWLAWIGNWSCCRRGNPINAGLRNATARWRHHARLGAGEFCFQTDPRLHRAAR
jgi:hypothetical protein